MSTIKDYLEWRGDLEFSQDAFNIVDNLVLSAISYVELDLIFENDPSQTKTLEKIAEEYERIAEPVIEYRDNSALKDTPMIMKMAAHTNRYSKVLVRNYVNRIDVGMTLQFSAVEFLLPDGSSYVAFRGTDDTIVGWKEDFMLAVSETEAEKMAVAYLNRIANSSNRPLRVGGHSKGAHLAAYAAIMCQESVQNQIQTVFVNDGPGFFKKTLESESATRIKDRVIRIIPEESLVGMLMEPLGKTMVVKSEAKRIMQHDILSWCVSGKQLVITEDISDIAKDVSKAISDWLSHFEVEKRQQFVDELFSVLMSSGAETLLELQEGGFHSLQEMRKSMNEISAETRDKIWAILKGVFLEVIN